MFVNAITETASWHTGYIAPIEVTVGGATVFALPVERFARFGVQSENAVSAAQEAGMKLVIANDPCVDHYLHRSQGGWLTIRLH